MVKSGKHTVLLVDDDVSARSGARLILEHLGYRVVDHEDGHAALKAFRANPAGFSFAVLDLSMPGMNGEQCVSALRRLRPDLPIILTSGSDEEEMMLRVSSQGLACLQKPYSSAALAAKIEKFLCPDG